MSFISSRQVVVDDTDHQILYRGSGWSLAGSQDTTSDSEHTSLYTLHNTNVDGSLSFSFQGIQITVLGINDVLGGTWQCFVDNVNTASYNTKPIQMFPGNLWELCSTGRLKDGPHELTVNVITDGGRRFSLDSIRYLPSPGLPLDPAAVLVIDSTDPEITYDSGWRRLGNTANMAQTFGSTASFNFTGTSLSWIGSVPWDMSHTPSRIFVSTASFRFTGTGLSWIGSASWDLPHIPSQGTYSIDGGPQVSFRLEAISPGNITTQYHQEFFSIGGLPAGPHTLQVTYQGNESQIPLTLDYLQVMTSSSPATITSNATATTSTGTSARTSPSSSVASPSTPSRPVGAIVGGVVTGTAFIILILALFFWYRRRNGNPWRRDTEALVTPYPFNEGSHQEMADYDSMLGTPQTREIAIYPDPVRLPFSKSNIQRLPQEGAPPRYTNTIR